jgi:hypothetical protein
MTVHCRDTAKSSDTDIRPWKWCTVTWCWRWQHGWQQCSVRGHGQLHQTQRNFYWNKWTPKQYGCNSRYILKIFDKDVVNEIVNENSHCAQHLKKFKGQSSSHAFQSRWVAASDIRRNIHSTSTLHTYMLKYLCSLLAHHMASLPKSQRGSQKLQKTFSQRYRIMSQSNQTIRPAVFALDPSNKKT